MRATPRWATLGLALSLVFAVAWRWHTIGPVPGLGFLEGTIVRSGEAEPLDCDEAIYAYMGRRVLAGDVLYRDLTENKPPLGYWLYAGAVALGGATESTVRLMAIPYVLATLTLVWWIALRLAGPAAACLAGFAFAVGSADPYLFGNGSNMEHFLNLFSVGSLALMLTGDGRPGRRAIVAAGVMLGLAALVKQVAVTHGVIYAVALLWPDRIRSRSSRWLDLAALGLGFLGPCVASLVILIAQGAGPAAYDDIVRFAVATARDIPAPPHAPPKLVRWVTGNADPQGRLPWPFGKTDYYVWWGAGLWPLWLASVPATVRLLGRSPDRRRVLLGAWTVSAWVQVLLPGQFWQHYYLLPMPGAVLTVSLWLADAAGAILGPDPGLPTRGRPGGDRRVTPGSAGALPSRDGVPRRLRSVPIVLLLSTALAWSGWIQIRDYLGKTPTEITSIYKGGRQWVALRALGRAIAARAPAGSGLFVWGWQSPLYLYAGLDSPTRHAFANELLKAHASRGDHPLVGPRVGEILRDLAARPPLLVYCGDVPFPGLRRLLDERYLPSLLEPTIPDGRGLWVDRARYDTFHNLKR